MIVRGETGLASRRPLGRLAAVCRLHGPPGTAMRLGDLEAWLADDMQALEAELAVLLGGVSIARLSARHQLDSGGKLLRPMCVMLAAKLGRGFGIEARHVAVAAELIHNATLLHDDVIDLGERRRGAPAARVVYGNAASVLAGDCLLVEALKRIQRCDEPGLLHGALETIEKMIAAEAVELENRGHLNIRRTDYFRVIEGKTAALFRWAMMAGATAGRLTPERRADLERYGGHLGRAFQLVDDLLDVSGDPRVTGKTAFTDLRQGKMTFPLLLVLERDVVLRREVERFVRHRADTSLPDPLRERLRQGLVTTGSIDDCRTLARESADDAIACLASLPDGPCRAALAILAAASANRQG